MKIDLENGTYIQIGGELGRFNSIPIDVLIKIAENLQNLIYTLAKYDLPTNDLVNFKNFRIELTDFKKGSAVPCFAYSSRAENKVGHNWQVQRNTISNKFDKLVEISNTGDYYSLRALYPEPEKRNAIVEDFFSFVNDFGSSPVAFLEIDNSTEQLSPIYHLKKFKKEVKKELIVEVIKENTENSISDEGVGKIIVFNKGLRTTRRIIDYYSKKNYSLGYAPTLISFLNTLYHLKYPLRCLFEKEEDYFVIQSELLGIIGTGLTKEEAIDSFNEDFDYLFKKLNSLNNEQLTNHNIFIKSILNSMIENIEIKEK